MNDSNATAVPPWASRLGHAGLLPFVVLAAGSMLAGATTRPAAMQALLAYGATIASFLGAIHWGLAMRAPADEAAAASRAYLWGVVPSLLAWCALLLGGPSGLLLLFVLLWACYAVDHRRYPAWGVQHWLGLRLRLTTVASLSCAAVAVHQAFGG